MASVKSAADEVAAPVAARWRLTSTAAGAYASPENLPATAEWLDAAVPGTVAAARRAAGSWRLECPEPLHHLDHWYVADFEGPGREVLRFSGLATLAEVWLNGALLFTSRSMFEAREVSVELRQSNRLAMCFRALSPVLAASSAAGRWRPRMIAPSSLRNVRTTVLGHMKGWCPGVETVGPWRSVERVRPGRFGLIDARIEAGLDGSTGTLSCTLSLSAEPAAPGVLSCCGREAPLVRIAPHTYAADLRIEAVEPWWPHTHGKPALHEVTATFGAARIDLGRTGFRSITVDRGCDGKGFGLIVNGVPVFCRGAVWASSGLTAHSPQADAVRPWLVLARDAGMNMLRVPGTTVYEGNAFYEMCDELGLLVWQDFMFANFDYPASDVDFLASVTREAQQFLARTQASPSLAVFCGGSEVYQQGAMMGLPLRKVVNPLFDSVLPAAVEAARPGAVYVPGSPSGGPLPFVVDDGVGHYFGVGGYRRPLSDARAANVRFASECLAFANVPAEADPGLPDDAAITSVSDGRWAARVPRDVGSSWDFEDVRDHYVELLFGVDARRLKFEDEARYLDLSRAAQAEVMQQTFAEFMRPESPTRGGLVLMLQDFWSGAGWGVIGVSGAPKSCYYALKRAFQPLSVSVTDEGVNGLAVHLRNDLAVPRRMKVQLTSLRAGKTPVANAARTLELAARSVQSLSAYDLLGAFFDINYAYRFQPPQHDAVVVSLRDADTGALASQTCLFPAGPPLEKRDIALSVKLERSGEEWQLRLAADQLAAYVHIVDPHYIADDDWFHLPPGDDKIVCLRPRAAEVPAPAGEVRALNAAACAAYRGNA